MNRLIITVAIAVLLLALVPKVNAVPTHPQQQDEKMELYTKFYEARKVASTAELQKALYPLAKEYLSKYGADTDQYTEAVRKFVESYERAVVEFDMANAFNAKDYNKAIDLGRQILSSEPENFYPLSFVAQAGFYSPPAEKAGRLDETLRAVRKGIELLEAGQVKRPAPFETLDRARGSFYMMHGWLTKDDSPAEAAKALRKAIQSDPTLKTNAAVHTILAQAVVQSEYTPLVDEYRQKFNNKPETADSRALAARVRAAGDRSIDTLARAIALSTQPNEQEVREQMLKQLTTLYTFFNGSEAGLKELIATVLSKPMP